MKSWSRSAYDEIRLAASSQPSVAVYLLESIALLEQSLEPPPRSGVIVLLDRHARLIMDAVVRADLSQHDLERVRRIYEKHFGDRPSGALTR